MAVVPLKHDLEKKSRKIQKFFLATIFFKNSFFCGISSLVSTAYIVFIKIGQAISRKTTFYFFFPPL